MNATAFLRFRFICELQGSNIAILQKRREQCNYCNKNWSMVLYKKLTNSTCRVGSIGISRRTKRDPLERDTLLNQILQNDDWIIEGVYFAWCKQCFEDADKIYVLDVPRHKYRYRIVRRFIRRKLGVEKEKKGLCIVSYCLK